MCNTGEWRLLHSCCFWWQPTPATVWWGAGSQEEEKIFSYYQPFALWHRRPLPRSFCLTNSQHVISDMIAPYAKRRSKVKFQTQNISISQNCFYIALYLLGGSWCSEKFDYLSATILHMKSTTRLFSEHAIRAISGSTLIWKSLHAMMPSIWRNEWDCDSGITGTDEVLRRIPIQEYE